MMTATVSSATSTQVKKDWKLYQFYESPFCNKIRRVLAFKGLLERTEVVEIGLATPLKSIHPQGKLPVLEFEDGTKVCDSTDIAIAIEKRHPQPSLFPTDPRDKALCHIIEDWADESLYFHEMRLRFLIGDNRSKWLPELAKHSSSLTRFSMSLLLPTILEGVLDKQGLGRKTDAEFMQNVEKHVQAVADLLGEEAEAEADSGRRRRWLLGGESLTIADISAFSQLNCFAGTPEGLNIMQRHPQVMSWLERVRETTEPEPNKSTTTSS